MLIRRAILDRIVAGEITLQFRRQKRPTVKTGGRLRTRVGELAIHDVREISEKSVTAADAEKAGFASRAELIADLSDKPDTKLYRVELSYSGDDARAALRDDDGLSRADVDEIAARLERFDRSSRRGPWTAEALDLIERYPARRAPDLAEEAGHDTKWFKGNIRKLKELGLTESLAVGYRLSPRGRAFRARRG